MKLNLAALWPMKPKPMLHYHFPDWGGMLAKEISVKNLANIIQARMSEILDFVTYHLKQIGMDNRHLTEDRFNRWRLPAKTPHSAYRICNRASGKKSTCLMSIWPGAILKLAKPTYSTCLGLILKGYDDFENNQSFWKGFKGWSTNRFNQKHYTEITDTVLAEETVAEEEITRGKRNAKGFWGVFKDKLIDIFKEERQPVILMQKAA